MENTTLFDDHNDVLLLAYKICTPVGFALNTLAIYLIVFKSTVEMKTYRWHLLNYQIWAVSIDTCITVFFQPVAFLPLIAISGNGIPTRNFGISTFTCLCITATLMCCLSVSILELFIYRHQCISTSKLTKKQFYFYILFYFFIYTSFVNVCLQLIYIDPLQWGESLEKWNPKAIELLKIPNVLYIPNSHISNFAIVVLFTLVVLSFLFLLSLLCDIHCILRRRCNHLSVATQKLHKKFLLTLILQVSVPLVFLFIPAAYTVIRIFDGRLGLQILNNIAVLMVANYGTFTNLFLIYFNDPYRRFILRMLERRKRESTVALDSLWKPEISVIPRAAIRRFYGHLM